MARGREIPPCSKTYGFPIYCAAWVPFSHIAAADSVEQATAENKSDADGDSSSGAAAVGPPPEIGDRLLVALGGGGGEGSTGVPNVLAVSCFDFTSRSLADIPVFRMVTGTNAPYRMAIHPKGDGIICSFESFTNSCRWYQWELSDSKEVESLVLNSSEEKIEELKDVGLQLALSFNEEGSLLAIGGEDGKLRVFKWPAMVSILEETVDDTTVKDLDFSLDGKFLASLRNSGPCRVWDLKSSEVAANLPRETGEMFGFCRFSRSTSDNNQFLFVTAMHGDNGKIIIWNTDSWRRVGSKKIVKDSICAFNVSPDGKLLAVGTIEGNILVLSSKDLQVQTVIKKAHLGIVTALVFSQDSRSLLSSSFDSTARVTVIEKRKPSGLSMWLVFLVIILAILVYYLQSKELL